MPVPSYLLEQKEREIQQALRSLRALPTVTRAEVGNEDACPICLLPFEYIFKEHEAAEEKQEGPSDLSVDAPCFKANEMAGVVKLSSCGHIFCRKDLAEWIESHHGSCPTCRRTFFAFSPIDEAEYESSDGGEYVPDEDDEDDVFTDDGEFDLVATSDVDYDMDDVDSDGEVAESEGMGYAPLARVLAAANAEADAHARRRAALVFAPRRSSDFLVHAPDIEDNESAEEELVDDALERDDVEALSFGSDSPSSEGVSVNNEDGAESSTTKVEVVFVDNDAEANGLGLSASIDRAGLKSPVAQVSGPSNSAANITQ